MALIEYHPPREPWLDIVYHDNHIMAVNKPSGLLSVPGNQPQYYDSVMSRISGRVDLPLICDWENRPRQKICFERGKRAVTFFDVLERLPNNVTRVKLTPITGRSHQLRLHMLALGHPILGDKFYAPPYAKALATRLCLHAESLQITHPLTGEIMTFTCQAEF